jgi:hypothetical protein
MPKTNKSISFLKKQFMAQEKETPMQLLEKFMIENNYPIDSKLLSYILVLDMHFANDND